MAQIHRQKNEELLITAQFPAVTCEKGVGDCHMCFLFIRSFFCSFFWPFGAADFTEPSLLVCA
jgi:hypothetical protein